MKKMLMFLVLAKMIGLVLSMIYAIAARVTGSAGEAVIFTFTVGCVLALPSSWLLDKVTKKRLVGIGELTFAENLFREVAPLHFSTRDTVEFRTRKGRILRSGRIVGYDFKKSYPRIAIRMPEGNILRRKPQELRVMA